MMYKFSIESQRKQVKYEALAKFDQSSAAIIEVAGYFISAINNKQDLSNPNEKIKMLAASQIGQTENLQKFFPQDNEVTKYQDALSRFSNVAANTFGSTQMKDWVESFGNVIDSKSTLSKELYGKLGVRI